MSLASSKPATVKVGYKEIYSFKGGRDGLNPDADLLYFNGKLYGTTVVGGGGGSGSYCRLGCGTVFELTLDGSERILHRFSSDSPDGIYPEAGLVALKGALYGTTFGGGSGSNGTVYQIDAAGHESTIYSVGGPGGGSGPASDLLALDDILYGTTAFGGTLRCYSSSCGTVFRVSTSGKARILYRFKGGGAPKDGFWPYTGLTFASGFFYGTTIKGGANGGGTVFRLTQSGAEHVMHSFPPMGEPLGSLVLFNGELYGTSKTGGKYSCGFAFAVTLTGKERVVHFFKCGPTDGGGPQGRLVVLNGNLYGVTLGGGSHECGSGMYRCGTVYELNAAGRESVLYDFKGGKDGSAPSAGLTVVNGTLYGVTGEGGPCKIAHPVGCGTVFELSPPR